MTSMRMRELLTAVLSCALCAIAGAQGPAASGYPNVDRPMAIAPGDTVQLLNRLVIDRAPGARGTRLDVQYATRIPASDVAAREAQADRLAQIFGAEAAKIGARKVSIGICDTRACAEAREPPRQWFLYERGIGGVWQRAP
jgi:hypothetical protein